MIQGNVQMNCISNMILINMLFLDNIINVFSKKDKIADLK